MKDNYKQAFSEALYVIDKFNVNNKNKISPSFIKFMERNKLEGYSVDLPSNILEHEELLKRETKIILSLIYRDYFCNDLEKKELDEQFLLNEKKYEEELNEKYSVDNIFNDNNNNNNNNNKETLQKSSVIITEDVVEEKLELIEHEEEKWYKKVFNKIKLIFSK